MKRYGSLLSFFSASAVLFLIGTPSACIDAGTAVSEDLFAVQVHALVNEAREKAGLKALFWDDRLALAAKLHSQDMARNMFFDHVNLKLKDPSQRAEALGVLCGKDYGGEIRTGIAENIFRMRTAGKWKVSEQIASEVVEGWMKRQDYRENVLDPEFSSEGIGVAFSSDGEIFVTQDFCLGRYSFPERKKRPILDAGEIAMKVHALVNREREKRRIAPLEWNDHLADIACAHSDDMAKKNYFSHVNGEGRDPSARAEKAGFRCEKKWGSYVKVGIGENISQNNTYRSATYIGETAYYDYRDMDEIARTTVDGWMKSEGHRENILRLEFASEGIGVAVSETGEVYITQDFC